MSLLIVALDACAAERSRVGGKAAGLANLMQHGFPVPPGFVVTAEAHASFLQFNRLDEPIAELLAELDARGTEAGVVSAARKLRALVETAPLGPALEDALSHALRSLRARHVAVRSSAEHEDGAYRSWAGQLETELYVSTVDVEAALKRCWASMFGARALAYRMEHRGRARAERDRHLVGVLVQRMVPASKAGVAFSVDPVNGDDAVLVIEAVLGLGEAAVSGDVTPERHVLAKRSFASLSITPHRQTRRLVARERGGGTRWVAVPPAKRAARIAKTSELRALAGWVTQAEHVTGSPVDVEWAASGRTIYVLQCRSVTGVVRSASDSTLERTRWRFVHTRRRSPFFKSCFFAPMSRLALDLGIDYRMCPAGIVRDSVVVAEDAWRGLAARVHERWSRTPGWCLQTIKRVHETHRSTLRRWRKLARIDWEEVAPTGLASAIDEYAESLALFAPHVGWVAIGEEEMATRVRDGLARHFGADCSAAYAIAVDPVDAGTVHRERCALLKLAARRADGHDVRKGLEAHAATFGWMKNVGYFGDRYDVEHYASQVERMSAEDPHAALAKIEGEERDKRRRFRNLLRDVAHDPITVNAIRTANAAVTFRSYRTEIFYQSYDYVRSLLASVARRLRVSPGDVLFLLPDEIASSLRGRGTPSPELIAKRRLAYVWLSLPGGRYMTLAGDAALAFRPDLEGDAPAASDRDLKGEPAFAGKARGRAVIVRSVADLDRVERGDVLIAPATNIDFVPALQRAAALVTEEGGILCHAAIVSREMRIPAVIGVQKATRLLVAGDIVEVDANCGVVRRVAGATSVVAP